MRETASRNRRSAAMGCLQSEQALDALVDLDLHFVDGVFFGEHGFGEVLFGIQHGVHRLMDGALGEAAHPQQPLLQFFQIVFEMAFHGSSVPFAPLLGAVAPNRPASHPKRPVMYASVRGSVGVVNSFGCLAVLDQFAIEHERREIAGAGGLLHVVRDDRHGAAILQLEHQLFDLRGGHRIERRARLIEQQHLRDPPPERARCTAAAAGRPKERRPTCAGNPLLLPTARRGARLFSTSSSRRPLYPLMRRP